MQGWLSAWYQIDYVPMNMSQMMDMMGGMHRGGMMHGTPDAGHMSQRILKNAEHKELRAMAEQIIKDQTK